MPPTTSIVHGIEVLSAIDAVRLRQSNGMPRYWMRTRPSRTRTCGVAPSNRPAIQVGHRAARPEPQVLGAAAERESRRVEPAQRRAVLGRAAGDRRVVLGGRSQAGGLGLGQRGHPAEEVVDRGQLLGGVLADLGLGGALERAHQGLEARRALRDDLDDDPPAIGGVGGSPHVARLLEAVDHPGDGARGHAHELGELAGRGRAAVEEELEGVDVRLGQAEPDGDGLAEDRALEVDAAKGLDDRLHRLIAIHG